MLWRAAGRLGRVKRFGAPDLVLCDFDAPQVPDVERIERILDTIAERPLWYLWEPTAHGLHLTIRLARPLDAWQILCLQALLGSDWRREAMNWFRLYCSQDKSNWRWNVLYEYKLY